MKKDSELLAEALELIRAGWCKHYAYIPAGEGPLSTAPPEPYDRYCAAGACGRVVDGPLVPYAGAVRPKSRPWSAEEKQAYGRLIEWLAEARAQLTTNVRAEAEMTVFYTLQPDDELTERRRRFRRSPEVAVTTFNDLFAGQLSIEVLFLKAIELARAAE